jgi:tetratricopeptide (TPR) repeat protein
MNAVNADGLKEEGLALFKRGETDRALIKFEEAVEAYADVEDDVGQAESLNNIGVIYRLKRKPDAAIDALRRAEAIFARLGDLQRRGQVLGNLGDQHADKRQRDEAARCYSEAAALFSKAGDPDKQSQVLRALSLLRLRQGRWLDALTHMEESLRVRPQIGLGQRLFRGLLRFALGLLTGGA